MPQDSYPWSTRLSGSITDLEYENLASHWHTDGLLPLPSGTSAPVIADGTGLHVLIPAGTCMLIRGRFWTSGQVQVALPIPPNVSVLPRTDHIVVRTDRAAATADAHIINGTPAAAAPVPPLVRTPDGLFDVPLATVRVQPTATVIGPDHVTITAPFADSGWITLTPPPGSWTVIEPIRARKHGPHVQVTGALARTRTPLRISDHDGELLIRLPEGMTPAGNLDTVAWVDHHGPVALTVHADTPRRGQVWIIDWSGDITPGRTLRLSAHWVAF
jgi:hypothetical protein